MSKSILDLVIRFQKEGSADKDSVRALVSLKSAAVDVMGTMTALAGVGYALNTIYQNTVKVFQDYVFAVADLSRVTGMSMEDTSRMIQVADDLRISYEDLGKALWFASKGGVEVNIESMARLADEYQGFNSATEKASFLQKNFGKGGADLGKLMELEGDGIRSATAAVEENLVMTEKAEAKAKALHDVQDTLRDSFGGLQIAAGDLLAVPIVAYLSFWEGAFRGLARAMSEGIQGPAQALEFLAEIWNTIGVNVGNAMTPIDDMTTNFGEQEEAIERAALAADNFKTEMDDLRTLISGDLGRAYDDHTQKIADLTREMENSRSGKDKAELQVQIDAETAAYERQTNAILYNIQSQIIMRDTSITDEEKLALLPRLAEGYGLIDEKTRGAVDATNSLVSAYLNQAITGDEFVDSLRGIATDAGRLAGGFQEGAGQVGNFHAATGALKETATLSKEPIGEVATSIHEVGKEADYARGEVDGIKSAIETLDGMVATVTIIVNTIGDIPSPSSFGPGQNVARCFAAETQVQMADESSRAIEQIKVGDVVQSWDTERGERVSATVERVFEHPAGHAGVLLEVTFEGRSADEPLRVTPEHKLYINGVWHPAWSLRSGDELTTIHGETIRVAGVWRALASEAVYNLETGHETHNYFAGGVLVHNGKAKFSSGGQWTPGNWALVGDMPGGGVGPYTEVIDPWGYIHNARETRQLAAMGVLKGAQSLYFAEGTGSDILDNAPRRRPQKFEAGYRPIGSSIGGLGTSLGGGETASMADLVGTLQESAASTSQAAFAASRSADMQAQQSVRQTDVLRSGNEAIVSELQELRRDLPAALQDAVKLVV
jgi:hypothetical protein